jgi:branched-chain amino acid aminotransferase
MCLDAHVRRLFESCRLTRLEMPYTREQIRAAILEAVARNGHKSCYIRPLIYRGSDSFSLDPRSCPTEAAIITIDWGRYLGAEAIEKGVDVMVSSWRRIAPNTSPVFSKTGGNYVNSQFVAMEAKDYGFVEGIALDVHGFVSEGSGENVFAVYRGVIYTPSFGSSILMGITRDCAITLAKEMGYDVHEQMIPRDLLYVADEIFFTGTAAEITPVRSVDHVAVGSGERGPVTKGLQDEFFGIVSGQIADRHGWLTYVQEGNQ